MKALSLVSLVDFYETFKGQILSVLYNFFQQIEAERKHSNSFCEASVTVIPKPYTDIDKKHTNISHEHGCTSHHQNIRKLNKAMC